MYIYTYKYIYIYRYIYIYMCVYIGLTRCEWLTSTGNAPRLMVSVKQILLQGAYICIRD